MCLFNIIFRHFAILPHFYNFVRSIDGLYYLRCHRSVTENIYLRLLCAVDVYDYIGSLRKLRELVVKSVIHNAFTKSYNGVRR